MKKKLNIILIVIGLVLTIGSAGAVEYNLISPTQGIIQAIICLIAMLVNLRQI